MKDPNVFNNFIAKYSEEDSSYLFSSQKINWFYFWMHQHFFAHFFAKIINPHIKCDLYINLIYHKKYAHNHETSLYETAIKLIDGKRPSKLKSFATKDLYKLSQLVGHYLAEYFYQNWANQLELILDGQFLIPKNHNDFVKFRTHCLQHHPQYQQDIKRAF